jgi:PTS system galactitol-specific IIA component
METTIVEPTADGWEGVLRELAEEAHQQGYVEENYKEFLLDREREYPTGLEISPLEYGLAIPHADPDYVREQALILALPDEPVSFQSMDDPSQTVDAEVILLLVIEEEEEEGYTNFLSNLIPLFQDEHFKELVRDKQKDELLTLILKQT